MPLGFDEIRPAPLHLNNLTDFNPSVPDRDPEPPAMKTEALTDNGTGSRRRYLEHLRLDVDLFPSFG